MGGCCIEQWAQVYDDLEEWDMEWVGERWKREGNVCILTGDPHWCTAEINAAL